MDSEKLKQFGLPIIILLVTLIAMVVLIPKVIENINLSREMKAQIADQTNLLEEKQAQLETAKKEKAAARKEESNKGDARDSKPFYKPIDSGLDTEAIISGEFAEILLLVRANQIKVRSIKYDYNPDDDRFVQGDKDRYNVARLNMEMIANYTNYNNFLKELYKHEHFLDIQSVEIVPYRKNKKILLINFKLKLYAQK